MRSPTAEYIDSRAGNRYPLDIPRWKSDAGHPLSITALSGIDRRDIDRQTRSVWRYSAAMPVQVHSPVSLGEGCTPLVELEFRDARVFFKLEWFSPTGSFKDRGTSVMVSILRQQGITSLLTDSSGNAGASVAAYASTAGIRAKILVSASSASAKVVQMRAYGADLQFVEGTRQDVSDEALRQAEGLFYANHSWQPFFLQGTKTLAYELWEDCDYQVPDNIVIPLGAGSGVLGCDIGFRELLACRAIDRLPRLFAVQPLHCSPIHASFLAGADDCVSGVEVRPTIAEGTAIANPVRAPEVLAAIRRSGGATIGVSENEIIRAAHDLAGIGLYAEPTSACAAAAMTILMEKGMIALSQKTIIVLTGSGIKATQKWSDIVGATPKMSQSFT